MEKFYWETKDGKKIDIDLMTIEHLRKCLKMIVKNNSIKKEILEEIRQQRDDEYFK